MRKLSEAQVNSIQNVFDVDGGMLVINERESEYTGLVYEIKLRPNHLIDTEYHPINLSKHCIEVIKSIAGEDVHFNNTKTTFWII